MQFAIADIRPNPFRNMAHYPLRPEKMAQLEESFETTGYWRNIVARLADGGAEIAYGHHRLAALREKYGSAHEIDLIILDLDDAAMLQIMASENMAEWGTNAVIEHETIRATVAAFARGDILLGAVAPKTPRSQLRFAPSFISGTENDVPVALQGHAYTAQTLADFLGWTHAGGPQDKVISALSALEFIEEGLLTDADFQGLTTAQADVVIREARKARHRRDGAARKHQQQADRAARKAAEAKKRRAKAEKKAAEAKTKKSRQAAEAEAEAARREQQEAEELQQTAETLAEELEAEGRESAATVGQEISQQLKDGTISTRQAAGLAQQLEGKKKAGPPPRMEEFVRRVMANVGKILREGDDARVPRLDEIVRWKAELPDVVREDAAVTLRLTGQRFLTYADELTRAPRALRKVGVPALITDDRE